MTKDLRRLTIYYLFVFICWAGFRYFVKLPEVVSELWFKPVIWLVPLFWWQISDRNKRIELFKGKLSGAVFWGLVVGLFYYVLVKLVTKTPWWGFGLNQSGISLATAVVEEIAFVGIILPRLIGELKKMNVSLVVTGIMFAAIRLPINVFVYHLRLEALVGAFLLAFFVCMVNGFIRLRSKNTLAAILAHFLYLQAIL